MKSTQIHTVPLVFGSTTLPAHQNVGFSSFETIPVFFILSSSAFTFLIKESAILVIVGWTKQMAESLVQAECGCLICCD